MARAPGRPPAPPKSPGVAVLLAACLVAGALPGPLRAQAARYDGPIIDMHLHASTPEADWAGPGERSAAEGYVAPPGDSTAVVEAVDRLLRAFENLDWETFRGSFAEDATVFSPLPDAPERSGYESVFRSVFESIRERARQEGADGPPFMQIRPRDLRVRVTEGAALVTFHLGGPGDGEVGRRTLVLRETGGRWRIVHVHASAVEIGEDGER